MFGSNKTKFQAQEFPMIINIKVTGLSVTIPSGDVKKQNNLTVLALRSIFS